MTSFLIDGYNLIHFVGLLGGKAVPGDVERSRRRLLDLLRAGLKGRPVHLTVVFDASRGAGAISVDEHGITSVFAPADREADDIIEDLIREAAVPRRLTVVSDDHRLQQAAQRRGATAMKCTAFLDWLELPLTAGPPSSPEDEKHLSRGENDRLLQHFKDLDDELRQFFDPYDFTEEKKRNGDRGAS